jgi:NAD(P)-dependent dehydrogenase (short-subunit alcohol dehydrogenase family)
VIANVTPTGPIKPRPFIELLVDAPGGERDDGTHGNAWSSPRHRRRGRRVLPSRRRRGPVRGEAPRHVGGTMGVVVVTGSTRGIGLGLASSFLSRGQAVVVSGRSRAAVDRALAELGRTGAAARLHGVPCDVTDRAAVQALWDAAAGRFGQVDIWINNAGLSNRPIAVAEMSPADYEPVVLTNVVGTIHGCAVAMRGLRAQGGGAIWNLEGLGSDGRIIDGAAPYGTTKCAIAYLTRALAREARGSSVRVGSIQPGMVATDILREALASYPPAERARVRRIFNILADPVDTVAPWIVDRVLSSRRNGDRITRVSAPTVALRFLLSPFRRRELFR